MPPSGDNHPLKILITDPHLNGGGQVRYVTSLARELARMGHHPVLGCKPGSILVDKAREDNYPALNSFYFKGGLRLHAWWKDIWTAIRYIRTAKPDIIHVNGSQDHWIFGLANQLLHHPVCLVRTRHNTYKVHDMLPNRILNRNWTDFQIAVCDLVRRKLANQRTFLPERMTSIHNGVDANHFKPDPAIRSRIRELFGFRKEHLVCGIAARLVPAKGHTFLFQAVARLQERLRTTIRILVLGEGELREALQQEVAESGLANQVIFAGFREDMADCIQAFDIGVQPSIDCDTSSFSLKEQMATEKPVIASDYGGLPEIITDGVEGFCVPAGTVEPITKAIEKLAMDPVLRIQMGKAGRRRVLEEFTIQQFAQRTLETYYHARSLHRRQRDRA